MSTDTEPSTSDAPARASDPPRAPKKKKKTKKVKVVRQLDEREINAPDRQTLWMLGSMSLLGIVLWVFAHAGCNYHPPRETRRPRSVTTADLTRDPKDAAIELQQRLLTYDHKGALEIASGAVAKQIEAEQASCAADRAKCDAAKAASAGALTMGVVLERDPASAKVRVITHKVPEGPRKFLTLVEREGTGWKVTARVPDAPGAQLPAPRVAPMRMMPMDAFHGAGSVAPTGTPTGAPAPGATPASPAAAPKAPAAAPKAPAAPAAPAAPSPTP